MSKESQRNNDWDAWEEEDVKEDKIDKLEDKKVDMSKKMEEARMGKNKVVDLDMNSLDIKVSKVKDSADSVDFFADMQPVIKKKEDSISHVEEAPEDDKKVDGSTENKTSKFAAVVDDDDGWGSDGDWGQDL